VFLYGKPVDMRNSFDGLYALARHGLQQDPLNGQLFAFINRRATQMRVLYWDRSGWCLWAKRLEAGFLIRNWREVQHREMDWTALMLMLEGIEVKRPLKRYCRASKHRESRPPLPFVRLCSASPSPIERRRPMAPCVHWAFLAKVKQSALGGGQH
jgi:transposase